MKLNRMHVVLSAELVGRSAESNAACTAELESRLVADNWPYDVAEGCYKGSKEVSFVVQVASFPEVLMLMRMSQDFEQESVLLVDARNKGYILYNKRSDMTALGRLNESYCDPSSEHVDAYTKIGDTYYYTYNFNQER